VLGYHKKKQQISTEICCFFLDSVPQSGTSPQGQFNMLGRSESALRQGFAPQNACNAALAAKYHKVSTALGLQNESTA